MTKLSKRSGVAIFMLAALSSDGFMLNSHFSFSSKNRDVLYSSAIDQTRNSNNDSIDGISSPSNNQSPAPLASVHDWSAYLDESKGLIYYFNRRTGRSQWEPPANVVFPEIAMSFDKKAEMRVRLKSYLKDRLNDSAKDTNIIDAMEKDRERIEKKRKEAADKLNEKMSRLEALKTQQQAQAIVAKATSPTIVTTPTYSQEQQQSKEIDNTKPTSLPIVQQGEWSAYFDIKSGLVFYYNEQTKISLWDPPTKDFPRVMMENNIPKVLDPRTSNISMERALTMTMEEEEAKRKWEEAKEKEKTRKAKLRAEKAAADAAAAAAAAVEIAQEEKLAAQKRELAAEQKRRSEEALKLKTEEEAREKAAAAAQIAAEQQRLEIERTAEEKKQQQEARSKVQAKYEAAMAAELRRLEQDRMSRERKLAEAQVLLDNERLEKERAAAAAKKKKEEEDREAAERAATQVTTAETTTKHPVRPKEEPSFTVENVENMVAPLKATELTLYDILQCPPTATRSELKRAYITLAKETHPDALLQAGIQNNEIVPDKFVEISQAWKILGDSTSRRRYDREIRAKGVSTFAGSVFENWVMGAAKKMDEALSKAEDKLDSRKKQ